MSKEARKNDRIKTSPVLHPEINSKLELGTFHSIELGMSFLINLCMLNQLRGLTA